MKKFLFVSVIFLFTSICVAGGGLTYSLAENQKPENTYSFNLAGGSSFHIIVAKNRDSRDYDVIPFFADSSGNVIKMTQTSVTDKPNFTAAHIYNGAITAISQGKGELLVIDYNIMNGSINNKKVEGFDVAVATFFDDNRTLILHEAPKGDDLVLQIIKNGSEITSLPVPLDKETATEYNGMLRMGSDVINTQEYVKNGSLKSTRIYLEDDNIIITNDDKVNHTTKALIIDSKTGKARLMQYEVYKENYKQLSSFINGNRLFAMNSDKKALTINIFAIANGEKQASFSLKEDLDKYMGGKDIDKYLKKIHKSDMKPTLTVNRFGNNYSLRVDAVDINTYYYYDWWFFHSFMWQQQMMMQQQQQMMQNHIRNMNIYRGPSPDSYNVPYFVLPAEEDLSFTIPLDGDLKLMEQGSDSDTDYLYVDKQKMTSQFVENKSIKNFSACFGKEAMSYIYMDKKSDVFTIDRIDY